MATVRIIQGSKYAERLLVTLDCGHTWLAHQSRLFAQEGDRALCPSCAAISWDRLRAGMVVVLQLRDGDEFVAMVKVLLTSNGLGRHALMSFAGQRRIVFEEDVFTILET